VDAAASSSAGEGGEEQGSALRRLVAGRRSQICALVELIVVGVLVRECHDINVGIFHKLFLDA
jgi:hypothetical protein